MQKKKNVFIIILISVLLISLIIFGSGACKAKEETSPPPSEAPPENQPEIIYTNTQYGFSFTLPVSWKEYSTDHTVVSTSGNELDSGIISPGGTFAHIFNDPGTYEYHCSIHTTMVGNIVVEPGTITNNQK
jgi:hypothetical protein